MASTVQTLLVDDVQGVIGHFEKQLELIHSTVVKVNILVMGREGVGKSSLIEAAFGLDRAEDQQKFQKLENGSKSSRGSKEKEKASVGSDDKTETKRKSASGGMKRVSSVDSVKSMKSDLSRSASNDILTRLSWAESEYFHKFESEHLVLYDSRGLTAENEEDFIAEAKNFLRHHRQRTTDKDAVHKKALMYAIHVVWYIIDSRDEMAEFETRILREVLAGLPVLVVLSKSDIATPKEISRLRKKIEGLQLSHVTGICEAMCGEGASQESQVLVEEIIQRTLEVLPEVEAEAFLVAQRANFAAKDKKAYDIIKDFVRESTQARKSSDIQGYIAKMITRLSVLWNFRQHGHLYGAGFAQDLKKKYKFRDKVLLLVAKKDFHLNYDVAFGIMWNICVRRLNKRMVKTMCKEMEYGAQAILGAGSNSRPEMSLSSGMETAMLSPVALLHRGERTTHALSSNFQQRVDDAFASLNDENLEALAADIAAQGVDAILQEKILEAHKDHLQEVKLKKTWSGIDLAGLENILSVPSASTSLPTVRKSGASNDFTERPAKDRNSHARKASTDNAIDKSSPRSGSKDLKRERASKKE